MSRPMSAAVPSRPKTSSTSRPFPRPSTAAKRTGSHPKPAFLNDAQAFATKQTTSTKTSYIPLDRGPARALYNSRPDPSKAGVAESLEVEVKRLKTELAKEKKKGIAAQSHLRRLEVDYGAALKRSAALLQTSLPPAALRRIGLAASKSSAVQSLQAVIRELRAEIRTRDKHIDGIMRSSEATALLEVAAARDEYYREVLRLRERAETAEKDRDRMAAALERSVAEGGLGGVDGDGRDGGDDEGLLKGVVRAQHLRIQDLKARLAKASSGHGNRSPKKMKELLRQQAERVDFRGQNEARKRVGEKRRKDREREERELRGEE